MLAQVCRGCDMPEWIRWAYFAARLLDWLHQFFKENGEDAPRPVENFKKRVVKEANGG